MGEDSVKIKFIKQTNVNIITSYDEALGSVTYKSTYEKDEVEFVDVLNDENDFIYVQFENGELGFIPKNSFVKID